MLWLCKEGLPKIKQNYPDFSSTERISMVGREWRTMSQEIKDKWIGEAKRLKEKFERG